MKWRCGERRCDRGWDGLTQVLTDQYSSSECLDQSHQRFVCVVAPPLRVVDHQSVVVQVC